MEKVDSPIFKGLTENEWEEMECSSVMESRRVSKGSVIFHAGTTTRRLGIVLSGSVNIENIDVWGNRTLLGHVPKGQVFAETYAVCGQPLMVDAVANEDSGILFFDICSVFEPGAALSSWKGKIMKNMLGILAMKNISLSERTFCTAPKSIRERVIAYLSGEVKREGRNMIEIPFDRQAMADYLNVERSALSKELSKMKNDGMIDYKKNTFTIRDLR